MEETRKEDLEFYVIKFSIVCIFSKGTVCIQPQYDRKSWIKLKKRKYCEYNIGNLAQTFGFTINGERNQASAQIFAIIVSYFCPGKSVVLMHDRVWIQHRGTATCHKRFCSGDDITVISTLKHSDSKTNVEALKFFNII